MADCKGRQILFIGVQVINVGSIQHLADSYCRLQTQPNNSECLADHLTIDCIGLSEKIWPEARQAA